MSGLFGFSCDRQDADDRATISAVHSMAASLKHRAHFHECPLFKNSEIIAGQVQTPFFADKNPPGASGGLHAWIDGEINDPITNDPAGFLLAQYSLSRSFDFCKNVNGVFSAVIYDGAEKKIHCITDRFGLHYLYWSCAKGRFCWASELKAFIGLPWFNPHIAQEKIQSFLLNGFFSGDETWFDEVSLVPWGSVISFDGATKRVTSNRYWQIREYDGQSTTGSPRQYRDRLAALFERSVSRCCRSGERICVGLSGGLDSRAILAAIPRSITGLSAYSFGMNGSPDIAIAGAAARVRGVPHRIEPIDGSNWFQPRIEGVWLSDGMLDMMHMHGIEALPTMGELCDVELNGFLGDAVIGASYGTDNGKMFDRFFNRGRRMIRATLLLCKPFIHVRMPFTDYELVDYIVAVPPVLRKNSRLYNAMLVSRYPAYFAKIPWQKAGIPISYPHSFVHAGVKINKIFNRLGVRGLLLSTMRSFFDYNGWIRSEPARTGIERILANPKSLYKEFIDPSKVRSCFREHLSGKDRSSELCRYVTIELWLQQALNKSMRPDLNTGEVKDDC